MVSSNSLRWRLEQEREVILGNLGDDDYIEATSCEATIQDDGGLWIEASRIGIRVFGRKIPLFYIFRWGKRFMATPCRLKISHRMKNTRVKIKKWNSSIPQGPNFNISHLEIVYFKSTSSHDYIKAWVLRGTGSVRRHNRFSRLSRLRGLEACFGKNSQIVAEGSWALFTLITRSPFIGLL